MSPGDDRELTAPRNWRERILFWADVLNKAALPLGTLIITLGGAFVTNKIAERRDLRAQLSQREEAESSLRAGMFGQLIEPLFSDKGGSGDVERSKRLVLLSELLALNFHEHFELGPLLQYVYSIDGQGSEERKRLHSVARRVTSRQIAALGMPDPRKDCGEGATTPETILINATTGPSPPLVDCSLEDKNAQASNQARVVCDGPPTELARAFVFATSPDCQDRLKVRLQKMDWLSESIQVSVFTEKRSGEDGNGPYEPSGELPQTFTLSPFALPYSDNTLLRSGNRFGLYVRQVEPESTVCLPESCTEVRRSMVLSLVWFPRNFFPPRERPTDFAAVRDVLGMTEGAEHE